MRNACGSRRSSRTRKAEPPRLKAEHTNYTGAGWPSMLSTGLRN